MQFRYATKVGTGVRDRKGPKAFAKRTERSAALEEPDPGTPGARPKECALENSVLPARPEACALETVK